MDLLSVFVSRVSPGSPIEAGLVGGIYKMPSPDSSDETISDYPHIVILTPNTVGLISALLMLLPELHHKR